MFAAMYKLELDIILNPEAVDVRIKLVAFVGRYLLTIVQELFILYVLSLINRTISIVDTRNRIFHWRDKYI